MNDELAELTCEYVGNVIPRPKALRILGVAAAGILFVTAAFGQVIVGSMLVSVCTTWLQQTAF